MRHLPYRYFYRLIPEEMGMKNACIYAGITIGFIVTAFLSGCGTRRFSIEDATPAENRDQYIVQLTLDRLNEEQLKERYGEDNNPFIPPAVVIGQSDIYTFDLLIVNETPGTVDADGSVMVSLNAIQMQHDDRIYAPINRFRLSEFWNARTRGRANDSETEKGPTATRLDHVINDNVYPNRISVQSGSSYRGIIVFLGKYPDLGEGEIHVPVFTADGRIIGIFKDTFQY
jgi:hypothetical protein